MDFQAVVNKVMQRDLPQLKVLGVDYCRPQHRLLHNTWRYYERTQLADGVCWAEINGPREEIDRHLIARYPSAIIGYQMPHVKR